eukprot:scaffold6013_cov210-Isochrysis_galbana.AAC.6
MPLPAPALACRPSAPPCPSPPMSARPSAAIDLNRNESEPAVAAGCPPAAPSAPPDENCRPTLT